MPQRFTALPIGATRTRCFRAAVACLLLSIPLWSTAAERGDRDGDADNPPAEDRRDRDRAPAEDKEAKPDDDPDSDDKRRQAGPHPPHG